MRARRTLFAIAAGAALQYFLDPERGAARRNRARDRIEPVVRRGQERVEEARQDQQVSSYDTDFSDRLSSSAATTGLSGSDLSSAATTGYSGGTSSYAGTTSTGFDDESDVGLATPITPPDDFADQGLATTGLSTPATDLNLGEETPYADPADTYAGSAAPYTGTDDTFTSAADTYADSGSDLSSSTEVPVDDYELADRVRSQVLGRDEFSSAVINLDAVNGVVTLRGELDATTGDDLEQAVREVEGVRDVISYLHTPDTVAPNEEDVR